MRSVKEVLTIIDECYNETEYKYNKHQAVGAIMSAFINSNVSFVTNKENRKRLKTVTNDEYAMILIDFIIKRACEEEINYELGKEIIDFNNCEDEAEASENVVNMLISIDEEDKKVNFGDIGKLINLINTSDKVKSLLVSAFISTRLVTKMLSDEIDKTFIVSFKNNDNLKTIKLDGAKIYDYVLNEYMAYNK